MEYMASGRPVIATDATGHKDVLAGDGPLKLTQGSYDWADWFHADVPDILVQLERLYRHREELVTRGEQCRKLIEPWTWRAMAQTVVNTYDARDKKT